ncbi:acyl carrier protein 3, mitochondrial-like [Chenopodium quinoa]|uniref:acyl carrier protein 3, mitochondrial-like n=1 Tax=Chenopodium quinoa TaxID=63459 RepID=UPI000B783E1F|nr:acyl carrier protein 3, mitochondrial-like [Chenopodium quinoa]
MQSIKSSILRHFRLQASFRTWSFTENASLLNIFSRQLCTTTANSDDQIMDRVIGLVKKFNKTDTTKVTETTNFQKDLCLDSLERVELVMAFEQEFSIEIPEEEADKLTCCADVAKYILDETKQSVAQNS